MNRAFPMIVILGAIALIVFALSLGGDPWFWWMTAIWDIFVIPFEWFAMLVDWMITRVRFW